MKTDSKLNKEYFESQTGNPPCAAAEENVPDQLEQCALENCVVPVSSRRSKLEFRLSSPVSVEACLDDEESPFLVIDGNGDCDYACQEIAVPDEFIVTFKSRGFVKKKKFYFPDDKHIDFHLQSVLLKREIIACYDRDEALLQILDDPTAYAFEQLEYTGKQEDLPVLESLLQRLIRDCSNIQSEIKCSSDRHAAYLAACCAACIGHIGSRFEDQRYKDVVAEAYSKYPEGARKAYGHLFRS